MPITPTVTDSSALGCVINTITSDAFLDPISYRNVAQTTFVFWAYADKDVGILASGPTTRARRCGREYDNGRRIEEGLEHHHPQSNRGR